MIAMLIMIILISVAVPVYERSVRHAREVVLKENLWQMRRAIDQFRADKGRLPQGLDDLVSSRYLAEKPTDPILERAEWDEVMGEDTSSSDGQSGLVNVKSLSNGADAEGKAYSQY
jgi:general secretion pathway protein G